MSQANGTTFTRWVNIVKTTNDRDQASGESVYNIDYFYCYYCYYYCGAMNFPTKAFVVITAVVYVVSDVV